MSKSNNKQPKSFFYRIRKLNERKKYLYYSEEEPLIKDIGTSKGLVSHPRLATDLVHIDGDLYDYLEKIYRGDPIVRTAIDRLTDYTLQNDFRIYHPTDNELAENTELWMVAHGIYILMENIVRCLYMFGNAYVYKDLSPLERFRERPRSTEPTIISDHRVIHPANIYVEREPTGKVIGYTQLMNHTKGEIKFSNDDIIHIVYRPIADRTYGTGLIESIIRDMNYLRLTESEIMEIVHNYVAPLRHVSMGYTNAKTGVVVPANQDEIERMQTYMNGIEGEDIVTDNRVTIKTVDTGSAIGNIEPIFNHFKNNYTAGLGVPDFFYGSGKATEALGVVMHEAVTKSVRATQKLISYVFQTEFIPHIVLEVTKVSMIEKVNAKYNTDYALEDADGYFSIDEVKQLPILIFNPIESDKDKHLRLRECLNSGSITPNEYRKNFSLSPLKMDVYFEILGKEINIYDISIPALNILQSLEGSSMNILGRSIKSTGERTPKAKEPNTNTVDATGNPVATNLTTHKRKGEV